MIETKNQLRPPYPSSGLADKALEILNRIAPKKIDSTFVTDNALSTYSNAFKILDLYKWLGIIDSNGIVQPEIAQKLRLVGNDKKIFIQNLIKNAYIDLSTSVKLENAQKADIINYFVREHSFGQSQAKFAANLFLHLAKRFEIPISEELKSSTVGFKRSVSKTKTINSYAHIQKKTELENSCFDGIYIQIGGKFSTPPLEAKTQQDLDEILKKLKTIFETAKMFLPIKIENQNEKK